REVCHRRTGTEDEANEAGRVTVPGALTVCRINVLADPRTLPVGPRNFRADGPAREVPLALTAHVTVEALQHRDLIGCEAIGAVGVAFAFGKIVGGVEVALQRVIDDPVFEAVLRVAFFVNSGREQVQFRGRNWIRGEALFPVDASELAAGVVEAGRSG